jgi:hypothetical protein
LVATVVRGSSHELSACIGAPRPHVYNLVFGEIG